METKQYGLDSLSGFLEEAYRRYNSPRRAAVPQGPEGEGPRPAPNAQPTGPAHPTDAPQGPRFVTPEIDGFWDKAAATFQGGETVTALVTGWNRGGVLVRWGELQGFVPVSQLREIPLFADDESRDETLAQWVGEELCLRIIELDKGRNRLVFSERATIWGPRDGDQILTEIRAGETRRGYVSNVCDFGVFVDLGGIDGLIHISELSWGRVTHPRELLELGQEVEAFVLNVDQENRRVGLSLKRLQPNPWTIVEQKYSPGQVIPASITNIVDFGSFAQIEEGLEGLIHISELSDSKVGHPSEVVSVGDRVLVRVLRIDSATHRLGLSMRQIASPDSEPENASEDEPSQKAEWGAGPAFLY